VTTGAKGVSKGDGDGGSWGGRRFERRSEGSGGARRAFQKALGDAVSRKLVTPSIVAPHADDVFAD
jgi:ribosomal protein L44E